MMPMSFITTLVVAKALLQLPEGSDEALGQAFFEVELRCKALHLIKGTFCPKEERKECLIKGLAEKHVLHRFTFSRDGCENRCGTCSALQRVKDVRIHRYHPLCAPDEKKKNRNVSHSKYRGRIEMVF